MVKWIKTILVLVMPCLLHAQRQQQVSTGAPYYMRGTFTDDYRISYEITDSVWTQLPNTKFHILKWSEQGQYLIARNDSLNPGEPGLFTRIDFMQFKKMAPYHWGFCLTAYEAIDEATAENTPPANRSDPRKGCNGFPFSRMKRKSFDTIQRGK